MKEFLVENGFTLNSYKDGLFWVKFIEDDIYQSNEECTSFCAMLDGWVYHLSEQEFKQMVLELNK